MQRWPTLSRSPARRAFTLIELLVVVTVIVLLLAILMPSMQTALNTARLVKCESNLHQLGLATIAYRSDNFNKFWTWDYPEAGGIHSVYYWVGKGGIGTNYKSTVMGADRRRLNAYAGGPYKSTEPMPLAQCPSDVWVPPATGDPLPGAACYDIYGSSYSSNTPAHGGAGIANYSLSQSWIPGTQLSAGLITAPARFVIGGDSGAQNYAANSTGSFTDNWAWHFPFTDKRFNVMFSDGHASLTRIVTASLTTADYTYNYK